MCPVSIVKISGPVRPHASYYGSSFEDKSKKITVKAFLKILQKILLDGWKI
jgi:hypothetical protein